MKLIFAQSLKRITMHVWIIGSGPMAGEYIKVLKGLDTTFTVIGRSEKSTKIISDEHQCTVIAGGLEKYLKSSPQACTHAIVAVNVDQLASMSYKLLEYGIKNILIEKPAGLTLEEIKNLNEISNEKESNVYIGYNRRFYASVLKAKEIIKLDGGVTSFNFEFTEWGHIIENLNENIHIKEKYFLANSTHVVDLAFYLGGKPSKIATFTAGNLSWHNASSIFSGAGISNLNALFSYQANWESAGRWSVEILTKKHRLILRPIEKLQIQDKGSIIQRFVEDIDYSLDEKYKPGLYLQTVRFLNNRFDDICSIDEQYAVMDTYIKMANYI
jgi:predicted dehydrogenase